MPQEGDVAVIERYFGLILRHQPAGGAFGNDEEGLDFIALDGFPRLIHVGIISYNMSGLESIELPDQRACGMRVVLVNNPNGHIGRLSFAH